MVVEFVDTLPHSLTGTLSRREIGEGSYAVVRVELLTRVGCSACQTAATDLARVCAEFGVAWSAVDVDHAAGQHPELRAEYGDRLPVVLLDGREHSYLDVDEQRLRADLASALGAPTDRDG